MNRVENVRQRIDETIRQQPKVQESRNGFVHLYGVSAICVLLALRRGLDPQICAVTGMLHDIATYHTGDPTDHAQRGALEAEKILGETGGFTQEEITDICNAIEKHSAKDAIDGSLAELIKDADVLQQYLYNPTLILKPESHWKRRLDKTLGELAINL